MSVFLQPGRETDMLVELRLKWHGNGSRQTRRKTDNAPFICRRQLGVPEGILFVLGTIPNHVSIRPNQNGTTAKGR